MASIATTSSPVVFIGLPKGGTTSFHFLMTALSVPSFHVGGEGYLATGNHQLVFQRDAAACEETGMPSMPSLLPAYEETSRVIGDSHVFCMVNASGYRAFADDPWPTLWPYIDSALPDTKFVLWERDPTEWAASAVRFFRDDIEWHWLRFAYGACNMTARYQAHLERVARSHYAAVREHFLSADAPPSRRSRLLIVDYADPQAGRKVCEFTLGGTAAAAGCEDIVGMGKAMPGALLTGADQDTVKMPLGKPQDIPAYRACLAPGGAFSRAVRSAAEREAHLQAPRALMRRMERGGWRRRLLAAEERRDADDDAEILPNGYVMRNLRQREGQTDRAVAIGPALCDGVHAWMVRISRSRDGEGALFLGVCAGGLRGRPVLSGRAWGFYPCTGCAYAFESASEGSPSRGTRLTEEGVELCGRAEGETIHFRVDLTQHTLEVRVGCGAWLVARDADGTPMQLPGAVAPWVQLFHEADEVELHAHGTGTVL